jgi:hypothetical protein
LKISALAGGAVRSGQPFKMHNHFRRMVAMDRRRDIRRVDENRILLANNGIIEIVFAGGRVGGPRE